jgi:hypothetical protein
MSGWSTRVPVAFSNRELHRKGGEPDGVWLKVAVAEPRISRPGDAAAADGVIGAGAVRWFSSDSG